ncbi:MAG: hypothetical protein KBS64_03840 [Treponema sp.]|nr:hypothetical protein [Candidatus Treponema equi]
MFSNGINLNAASYNNVFSTSSGSLFVPVKPSAVIYSQLDYVHGTAAKSGQNGVPLSKVRILNTLINQLVSMKQKTSAHSESELNGMSEEQKDALIKEYQQQIKNAMTNTAQPATYGFAGLMPEAGAVVNVTA